MHDDDDEIKTRVPEEIIMQPNRPATVNREAVELEDGRRQVELARDLPAQALDKTERDAIVHRLQPPCFLGDEHVGTQLTGRAIQLREARYAFVDALSSEHEAARARPKIHH